LIDVKAFRGERKAGQSNGLDLGFKRGAKAGTGTASEDG
jgi:hypothetical protein